MTSPILGARPRRRTGGAWCRSASITAMLCSIVAACTGSDEALPATTGVGPSAAASPSSTSVPSRPPVTTDQAPATTRAVATTSGAPGTTDQAPCERLTDFTVAASNDRWVIVNDDVMGGRSLGGPSFDSDLLTFEGDVDTDGGGFASLRFPLEPGLLADADRVEVRARPDDRSYMMTFDDSLATRDRRVSHRAPIPFVAPGEWQTVEVSFVDLVPAVFGTPIEDTPFRADLATELGVMISDGVDGPFRVDIDWIDVCRGEPTD